MFARIGICVLLCFALRASAVEVPCPDAPGLCTVVPFRIDPPTSFIDLDGNLWTIRVAPFKKSGGGGFVDEESRSILINVNLALDERQETLYHELYHVVLGVAASQGQGNVHAFIYTAGGRMWSLLMRNPKLEEYIFRSSQ